MGAGAAAAVVAGVAGAGVVIVNPFTSTVRLSCNAPIRPSANVPLQPCVTPPQGVNHGALVVRLGKAAGHNRQSMSVMWIAVEPTMKFPTSPSALQLKRPKLGSLASKAAVTKTHQCFVQEGWAVTLARDAIVASI